MTNLVHMSCGCGYRYKANDFEALVPEMDQHAKECPFHPGNLQLRRYKKAFEIVVDTLKPLSPGYEEEEAVRKEYDIHVRNLIASLQAFLNHHRYPEAFNLPDLDEASEVWKRAADFSVGRIEEDVRAE